MPGTGWDRLLTLGYAPFLMLKNTSDRAVILNENPTISFSQPNIGFKFTRNGGLLPGDITSGPIQADQMYVNAASRGNKTYQIGIFGNIVAGQGSGFIRLAAGQSIIVSPVIGTNQNFDWLNNMTTNMKGIPGWAGSHNACWVDWLVGPTTNLFPGQNGGLGIIVTRDSDSWDLEANFTGASAGWRIFDLRPDASPVLSVDSNMEITQRPFKISDYRGTIDTLDMQMPMVASPAATGVQPLFSMIGPPIVSANMRIRTKDTLGNGLDDDWEVLHFQTVGVDPAGDEDGDGYNNLSEYLSGHSPTDPASRFTHSIAPQQDGRLKITWSSSPGVLCAIERSTNMNTWTQVTSEPGAGPPATSTSCVLDRPEGAKGYFRIRLSGDP